jgi:hypothetical protein
MTGDRIARLLTGLALASLLAQPGVTFAQSLQDAFAQGAAIGRAGNAAARTQIHGDNAQRLVPGAGANAPQTSYFGSAGLGSAAAAAAQACAIQPRSAGLEAQACEAANFSRTNPLRRPNFTIAPSDALLTTARAITANPQAIAGNLAGTYSGCTVHTSTTPERFETALCHQYRTTETFTCDRILDFSTQQVPGCTDGEFLTRVIADPCPGCIDYLAFDFSCAVESYRMHVYTVEKSTGFTYMDLGTQIVPGTLNTQIAQTPGPTRIDGYYCYETSYSQACNGTNCTIGAWFANPCQGTSFHALNSFAIPMKLSLVDRWDDQCAALEARTR